MPSASHASLGAFRPGKDGPWDRAAAAHLLRRAGFGGDPRSIDTALEAGPDGALHALRTPGGHDERLRVGVQAMLGTRNIVPLQSWWMALILADGDPLRERATLMWHDHFATSNDKVDDVRLMHAQNERLREHALGDFRELLRAMLRDPALIVWLDGNANRKGQPNENLARELLELFALGIGNYGESDVLEAARALTGWGTRGRSFHFRREHHDAGSKTVLGTTGDFDGDSLLDVVLAHPACARHVADKLLDTFVACPVGDDVRDALARVLVEREWSVGETLDVLLRSRLFYSESARRSRIAAPVEFVASTALALGAHVVPQQAARVAERLGQSLFHPPSVEGWKGGRAWIDAGTWIARHNAVCEALEGDAARIDFEALLGGASEPSEVAGAALERFLPDGWSNEYERALTAGLEQAPDIAARRRAAIQLILTSPEAQLA